MSSFRLHMLLINTFLLPYSGRGNIWQRIWVCDSSIGITWVQVSRLPVLHPDKDRWKRHHGQIYWAVHSPFTMLIREINNNNNDSGSKKENKI